jgi:hypothetical protein
MSGLPDTIDLGPEEEAKRLWRVSSSTWDCAQ